MSKKIVPGIFRFASMLFNVIINTVIFSVKGSYSSVWGLYVCFLWVLLLLKIFVVKWLYKYFSDL